MPSMRLGSVLVRVKSTAYTGNSEGVCNLGCANGNGGRRVICARGGMVDEL